MFIIKMFITMLILHCDFILFTTETWYYFKPKLYAEIIHFQTNLDV